MEYSKICSKCKKVKPLESFHIKNKEKGWRSSSCKSCMIIYRKEHYERNKEYYQNKTKKRNKKLREDNTKKLIEYLLEHPCVDCGESNIMTLEFDHQGNKSYNISEGISSKKWKEILKEIFKCQVRCANCHSKKTHKDNNTLKYKYSKKYL